MSAPAESKSDMPVDKCIIVAFDIETSGALFVTNHIMGLGAVAMDQDGSVLERLFVPCYVKEDTVFEKRCLDEFWSKNEDVKALLECQGPRVVREANLVVQFHAFRDRFEKLAKERGVSYYLVCDNKAFDVGFINYLYGRHFPTWMPMPYRASDGKYSDLIETHSAMFGVLLNMGTVKLWGTTKAVCEHFNFPKAPVGTAHHPTDDAVGIAHEMRMLLAIAKRSVPAIVPPPSPAMEDE